MEVLGDCGERSYFCFILEVFLSSSFWCTFGEWESFLLRKKVGLEPCFWTLEYFTYTLKITIHFSIVITIIISATTIDYLVSGDHVPIASPHAILIFSVERVVVFYFSFSLCFFKTVVVLKLNVDSEIRLVELILNSNRSNFPDSVFVKCCRVPSPPKLLNPTKNYRSERPNLQFQDENVFYSHVLSFAKTRQIIGNSVFHWAPALHVEEYCSMAASHPVSFFVCFLSFKKKGGKLVRVIIAIHRRCERVLVVKDAQFLFDHVSLLVCVFFAFDVVRRASVSASVFIQNTSYVETPTQKISGKNMRKCIYETCLKRLNYNLAYD